MDRKANGRLILSMGALFPYYNGNNVRLCPSPVWNLPQFQLKGTNVIFSYGCNALIFGAPGHEPLNAAKIGHPADTVIFADAAASDCHYFKTDRVGSQKFQEWYYVDLETNYNNPNNFPNTHFRHGKKANVTFADGHVDMEGFVPGLLDPRLPRLLIGQLPPQLLTP